MHAVYQLVLGVFATPRSLLLFMLRAQVHGFVYVVHSLVTLSDTATPSADAGQYSL